MQRRQIFLLAAFVLVYALVVFATYQWVPIEQLTVPGQTAAPSISTANRTPMALASAAILFVVYLLFGFIGLWFASRMGWPLMARSGAGWLRLFFLPLGFGAAAGIALVVIDRLIAALGGGSPLVHPQFPMSLLASLSAGIGEEILFRGLVMGLWAWLLNLLFNRWIPKPAIFIIANLIAALAFSAGHLPAAMVLAGVSSPTLLPVGLILEIVLLNSLLGLLAGYRSQKDGLVAAMGVHFWADIVWHVIVPLLLV